MAVAVVIGATMLQSTDGVSLSAATLLWSLWFMATIVDKVGLRLFLESSLPPNRKVKLAYVLFFFTSYGLLCIQFDSMNGSRIVIMVLIMACILNVCLRFYLRWVFRLRARDMEISWP